MTKQDIHGVLKSLSKKYQQKYGVAVFSIEAKETSNGLKLSGAVLTGNQKDELLRLAADGGVKISQEDIAVLSDWKQGNEIGWGLVRTKTANLRSRFVSNGIINEKILKRIRCSQAFRDEVLRILLKKEDQLLVQQGDLTLGWIDKKDVGMDKKNLRRKWNNGNFAKKDEIVAGNSDKSAIVKEARKYIGTKYVLGGRSESGIDCSGFVQAVYRNAAGLILPKHSWDQKQMGSKIGLKDAESGDLVFLIKKRNSHKHVGILVLKDNTSWLIHASLDKRKVIIQKMDEVLENYDVIEARRIF
ncbi:MAG: NlpC/P60 family protein [Candidatus Paceibacterota bacterium]|jgi:hypothetical protein